MSKDKLSEIGQAIEKAVRNDCEKDITVSFSGGIDSALVAFVSVVVVVSILVVDSVDTVGVLLVDSNIAAFIMDDFELGFIMVEVEFELSAKKKELV